MVEGKKKNGDDDDDNKILLWIFIGFLILLFLWWLFSDKKSTGGGGGGAIPSACNPALWTSKSLILPESFVAEKTNVSECDAQIFGQNNNKGAFIRCNTGDVMFLDGDSFTGTETACTDCKIYYTKDFTVTLKAESPPHMTITLSPSPTPVTASGACPQNPYPYCDAEDGEFSNVYITLNCHASTQLIQSFIAKGKLTGTDDPKIVKCCKTPDICRAAGVTAFPTVQCGTSPTIGTKIQGFCP